MTGRLLKSADMALGGATIGTAAPCRIGTLVSHDGVMLEAEGFAQPLGGGARIISPSGQQVRGEVVGFRGTRSLIVPFDHGAALAAGSRVEPDGDSSFVACGSALLGRVVDAHGAPLDGRRPIVSRFAWPIGGKRSNPLDLYPRHRYFQCEGDEEVTRILHFRQDILKRLQFLVILDLNVLH